ncbi:MAG: cytochrome c [Vicinamibacterales bacterium]|jgi:mono/diheme cytochrome c family protein
MPTPGARRFSSAFITAVIVAVLALVTVGVRAQTPGGNAAAARVKNPVASSPASIQAGAASYKKYCSFCHGDAAKGDGRLAPKGTTPANLTDATWDRGATDGEIFAVIMEGAGPKFDMKGFKGRIPDQDAWNIVNYIRSLGPARR